MTELKVQDFHGKQVIDSRDVAQMVERGHNKLMKTIRTYVAYLNEGEIPLVDFFIESSYVDSKGQTRPNYLITQKGCDMVANKLPGKKGVLFTAAYVTAFEEMRQALAAPRQAQFPEGVSLFGLASLVRITRRAILDMGGTPADVGAMIKETFEAVNFPVRPTWQNRFPDRPAFGTVRGWKHKRALETGGKLCYNQHI